RTGLATSLPTRVSRKRNSWRAADFITDMTGDSRRRPASAGGGPGSRLLLDARRDAVLACRAGPVRGEELAPAPLGLPSGRLEGLVVLGPLDQPDLLGLAGGVEQRPRHLRLDVRVGAAVDHQQWPRPQPLDLPLQVREVAAPLALDLPHPDQADLPVVPR